MKPCLNTGSLFWPAYLKTELGWWEYSTRNKDDEWGKQGLNIKREKSMIYLVLRKYYEEETWLKYL